MPRKHVRHRTLGTGSRFTPVQFRVSLRTAALLSSAPKMCVFPKVPRRFPAIAHMLFPRVMLLLKISVLGHPVSRLRSVRPTRTVRRSGGRCLGSRVLLLKVCSCVLGLGICAVLCSIVLGAQGVSGITILVSEASPGCVPVVLVVVT